MTRRAAQGPSNRAIAQALFVTGATLETQVRRVFQKLDLKRREELPDAPAD